MFTTVVVDPCGVAKTAFRPSTLARGELSHSGRSSNPVRNRPFSTEDSRPRTDVPSFMASPVVPKCPGCGHILDPKTDILFDNAGIRTMGFKGTSFMYCGFCGVVLGGAPDARTLTKKSRG